MNQTYILQKLNYNRCRRFAAKDKITGCCGQCQRLSTAEKFNTAKEAESFRFLNKLMDFDVVLSDGTDDLGAMSPKTGQR